MNSWSRELIPAPDGVPAPGWERVRALVLNGVGSPHSRRVYGKALEDFREWCGGGQGAGFTRETVQRYRVHLESRGLAPSSLNLHLTAIRKLAREASASGLLSHEAALGITGVKGVRQKGTRLGTWLTLEQAQALLRSAAGKDLRALRDRALLSLLVGCGLRRGELAALATDRVQQREGRWVVVDVEGKGRRIRSVPMPGWAKAAVDEWVAAAGIEGGRLFRAVGRRGEVGDALTAQAIYLIVRHHAERIGVPAAPHDLRRTFAKLAHRGSAPLEQIQLSLGHDSILTTERYLGVRQNLADAPCDHLGISTDQ